MFNILNISKSSQLSYSKSQGPHILHQCPDLHIKRFDEAVNSPFVIHTTKFCFWFFREIIIELQEIKMMVRFTVEVLWLPDCDLTEIHITWKFKDLKYHFLSPALQCTGEQPSPSTVFLIIIGATTVKHISHFNSPTIFFTGYFTTQSTGDDKCVYHDITECHDLSGSHFIFARMVALHSSLVQREIEPIPKDNPNICKDKHTLGQNTCNAFSYKWLISKT